MASKYSSYDWVKLGLENSKVILPLIVLLLSATGFSTYTVLEKEDEITATRDQLTNVANHFAATTTPKVAIKPDPCGACIRKHEKEHH